jgi:hypothetical protein
LERRLDGPVVYIELTGHSEGLMKAAQKKMAARMVIATVAVATLGGRTPRSLLTRTI